MNVYEVKYTIDGWEYLSHGFYSSEDKATVASIEVLAELHNNRQLVHDGDCVYDADAEDYAVQVVTHDVK